MPFGHFCFNKLLFKISSAPEHFQKRMSNILRGLEGVLCSIDDVLTFGKDQEVTWYQIVCSFEKTGGGGSNIKPSEVCV